MRPAGSDGMMVLSSGPFSSRPRLPALIPLAPEPRHGGGLIKKDIMDRPGVIPNKCHPASLQHKKASKKALTGIGDLW